MDNLENIFDWDSVTEPSIKDQILEAFPGKRIGFILRLNYNKIRVDGDEYVSLRYRANHNDHYAIMEKDVRNSRYGVETKRVLRDGVLYNVHLYGGVEFITFVLTNDAVLMPALEVTYSEYYDINNVQQTITKIQEIQRKEFAKRNWNITRIKRQLEERGLLVQPLGRRR